MKRRFITELDIRRMVKDEGKTELVLAPNERVTALAVETAQKLGLRLVNHDSVPAWSVAGRRETLLRGPAPKKPPTETPDALVAQIVAAVLQQRAGIETNSSGVLTLIHGHQFDPLPPATGKFPPDVDLRQREIVGNEVGIGLRAGFRTWRAGAWSTQLPRAEINVVLEGAVEITASGATQRAGVGDVLVAPANALVKFATPTWAKVFYVTS